MWKVLRDRPGSCHSPAHWNEKLVLGSPPHQRRRNSITSWPAGLWEVCRKREALGSPWEGLAGLALPRECSELPWDNGSATRMLWCQHEGLNPTHSLSPCLEGSGSP